MYNITYRIYTQELYSVDPVLSQLMHYVMRASLRRGLTAFLTWTICEVPDIRFLTLHTEDYRIQLRPGTRQQSRSASRVPASCVA